MLAEEIIATKEKLINLNKDNRKNALRESQESSRPMHDRLKCIKVKMYLRRGHGDILIA